MLCGGCGKSEDLAELSPEDRDHFVAADQRFRNRDSNKREPVVARFAKFLLHG